MSIIIPYNEKLGLGGAFIKPNGEIISLKDNKHEEFATNYCHNLINSNPTRKELEDLRLWLKVQESQRKYFYADFLVYILAFDKVERILHDVITTTSFQPHVRFYNYYLMDWHIYQEKPLVYNQEKGLYLAQKSDFFMVDEIDREAEEEINDIKRKVLIKDRPYFFK